MGAAWLRDSSKCHTCHVWVEKFHCDYIKVSKEAPRTYQKPRRRVENGIVHNTQVVPMAFRKLVSYKPPCVGKV